MKAALDLYALGSHVAAYYMPAAPKPIKPSPILSVYYDTKVIVGAAGGFYRR